jgi:hypothetical protein
MAKAGMQSGKAGHFLKGFRNRRIEDGKNSGPVWKHFFFVARGLFRIPGGRPDSPIEQ